MVKGYIINPEHHFWGMVDDSSRALYLGTVATKFITDYIVGNIPKKDLLQCIKEFDNFYNLSVQKEIMDMLNGYA